MGSESSLSLSEKTGVVCCSLVTREELWPFTRGVDEAISDGGGSTMLETEQRGQQGTARRARGRSRTRQSSGCCLCDPENVAV